MDDALYVVLIVSSILNFIFLFVICSTWFSDLLVSALLILQKTVLSPHGNIYVAVVCQKTKILQVVVTHFH